MTGGRQSLRSLVHLPPRGSTPRLFAWGLIDQCFSSATTLGFTIVAARTLGPSGLGTVSIGLAAIFVALGFERALVIDPLRARISTSPRSAREALSGALGVTVVGGLLLSLLALVVGLTTSGAAGRGILVFAPWIAPVLAQSLLRAWLYREGRGRTAATSTVVWLASMLAVAAAGLRSTEWQITAAWGIGACLSLVVAALGTDDLGLVRLREAASWFRHEAAGLGSWLAGSSILFSAATYVRVAGISSILGTAAVGGYRAIETAFAPVSLIGPALSNPGLPTMRDAVERRASDAWRLAVRLSLLSFGLVLCYVVVVVLAKNLVFRIFGEEFRQYQDLILPIASGQLVGSLGAGFSILLLAERRMRDTATLYVVHAGLILCLALPLAALSGLTAAAWGIAFAELPPLILVIFLSHRALKPSGPEPDPVLVGSRRALSGR